MDNKFFSWKRRTSLLVRLLAAVFCMSQLFLTGAPAMAAPGETITSPVLDVVPPAFLFEPEATFDSLKGVAQWNDWEQLLDNPYLVVLDPASPGNAQGYPAYRSTIQRRRSFIFVDGVEQPLPQFQVHPLNYNPSTGEEMRLLNPAFPGTTFAVPDQLIETSPGVFEWTYIAMPISPGLDRVGAGDAAIDFNSPMTADTFTCITTTEAIPPEGSTLCGGDPGEPNYAGFGVLASDGYSTPAVPGSTIASTIGLQLYDPTPVTPGGPARGLITARDPVTGAGGLRKPSLRIPEVGGTPLVPNYQANSFANLSSDPTALAPSNENDYVRDREAATVLGKALFWDMQVGSDCVQACGSCHFTAGVDDRTKNQLNPNHLGGDNRLQIHGTGLGTQRNQTVTAEDFPFHELANPDIPGEPLLNPDNVVSDTNDVMSSMGVRFGVFRNIPIPGPTAFLLPSTIGGVRSLRPDIAGSRIDPLGNIFQNLRRVEPRNTPTIFAAAMNFDNFWDSRARHDFNGGSVFGASDPQSHVMANDGTVGGAISPTRQIIRFSSIASLATGPALSNFEMSFDGRNWAKLGKKLLQDGVTPLANQLVDTTDSVLGPYSNQWIIPGMPGLWITYPELIEEAFYPQLWANRSQHLNGAPDPSDPFDGFSLAVAAGPAGRANRNQFTQMEANMALFFGLGVQIWSEILIPDDTPFDQMLDQNPDAFLGLGEAGEPLLVWDLPTTGQGIPGPSFTEVGNFKRDPGIPATAVGPFPVGTPFVSTGTRVPSDPDPLLGLDIFMGSNVSLKNPNFRAARCGACHLGANLTDNNITRSHQAELGDFVAEFFQPGHEIPIEPLGRGRTITGFGLESELNGNAQDAVERFIVNQSVFIDSDPLSPTFGLSLPDGAAFIDNGNYNLGVTPIANDISHGGPDPFGFPLSLAALMLKNLGGVDQEPGTPLPNFDPALGIGGGLFEESAQDQFINPGIEEEPADPMLPPYLAPWASNIPVGDVHPQLDEATFVQVNTLTETPIIEGFIDTIGPFNPAGVINEAYNNAQGPAMGTYPVVNRVLKDGAFKAPQLRNVELTGPYFHNGGKLTLRQVVDFYARGGDFPITNGPHRDMMIIDLRNDIQALGFLNQLPGQTRPDLFTQEEALEALVDFMLELTDERVKFEKAPFDRPEMIIPIDGRAPGNIVRRERLLNLANATPPLFRDVPAVGAAGRTDPLPNFLGISSTPVAGPNNDHFDR